MLDSLNLASARSILSVICFNCLRSMISSTPTTLCTAGTGLWPSSHVILRSAIRARRTPVACDRVWLQRRCALVALTSSVPLKFRRHLSMAIRLLKAATILVRSFNLPMQTSARRVKFIVPMEPLSVARKATSHWLLLCSLLPQVQQPSNRASY